MRNFTEWMIKKDLGYFTGSKNVEKLIDKKYLDVFLEEIGQGGSPVFSGINQRDMAFINEIYPSYRRDDIAKNIIPNTLVPQDVYGKIENATPYQLMLPTRSDPRKFQADVAKLQSANKEDEIELQKMTMNPVLMKKSVPVYILSQSGSKKFFKERVHGMATNYNQEKYIFMPWSSFDEPPSSQNPLGKLNSLGKEALAHEAGHASQPAIYQRSDMLNTRLPFEDYLGLPGELGTRLGFVKNANSKNNFMQQVSSSRLPQEWFEILNAFADNKVQNERFNVLVGAFLDQDGGTSSFVEMAANSPELKEALTKKNISAQDFYTKYLKFVVRNFVTEIYNQDTNISQFFDYLKHIKTTRPQEIPRLKQRLVYGYPKVALGEKPVGNQQADTQTT